MTALQTLISLHYTNLIFEVHVARIGPSIISVENRLAQNIDSTLKVIKKDFLVTIKGKNA